MADEAASWNDPHARFPVGRIDHSKLYSGRSGVYTNGAGEFFSRMRRAKIGHHHHIAGKRRGGRIIGGWDNGRRVNAVAGLAMRAAASVGWWGTGSGRIGEV